MKKVKYTHESLRKALFWDEDVKKMIEFGHLSFPEACKAFAVNCFLARREFRVMPLAEKMGCDNVLEVVRQALEDLRAFGHFDYSE
jgi:hypothetical protein